MRLRGFVSVVVAGLVLLVGFCAQAHEPLTRVQAPREPPLERVLPRPGGYPVGPDVNIKSTSIKRSGDQVIVEITLQSKGPGDCWRPSVNVVAYPSVEQASDELVDYLRPEQAHTFRVRLRYDATTTRYMWDFGCHL
jgi:hypothetical protein